MIAATADVALRASSGFGQDVATGLAAAGNSVTVGGDWGLAVQILQFGFIGVVLLCILLRKFLVPEWVLKDAETRHDKEIAAKDVEIKELKESNSALRTLTEQQIIPALVRANQLSADYAADLAAERRRRHGTED